ncbi:hypothetical protein MIMGU_mgv1a0249301mg, partial [Erythranthe guttata]
MAIRAFLFVLSCLAAATCRGATFSSLQQTLIVTASPQPAQ